VRIEDLRYNERSRLFGITYNMLSAMTAWLRRLFTSAIQQEKSLSHEAPPQETVGA
jgi:hypothetical protein